MAQIQRLPDSLVNQIAAGEVVERPASALKELLENSLDAGARSVRVGLAAGGRELIQVEDDGCGMTSDDARLALERHATSKISSFEDLQAISTLGFRGEALPSIAAASSLTLETAAQDGEGTRIEVDFGVLTACRPCARARGTTVSVRNLFERLPARRKFLRSAGTELRHALAAITGLAFTRPDVAFAVEHGGRSLLRLPAVGDAAARLSDLLGPRRARLAQPVRHASGEITVSGLLVPGGRDVVLAVNGRLVRDRLLVAAVNRALREGAGEASDAFLSISLPCEAVDVNVHPAKTEVRFADPGRVFAAITSALAQARARSHAPVAVRRVVTVSPASAELPFAPRPATLGPSTTPVAVREATTTFEAPPLPAPHTTPFGRYLGQYRETYLVCDDAEGLLLVDQHNAHERVLFDELRARPRGAQRTQPLLLPVVLELSPLLAPVAEEAADALAALGLELELASGNSVRVLALPAAVGSANARALVAGVLEDLARPGSTSETIAERTLASLACRAAIKKNHPIGRPEAEHLLARLAGTTDPHRCPHGRPIVVRLPHDEIERRIGRR